MFYAYDIFSTCTPSPSVALLSENRGLSTEDRTSVFRHPLSVFSLILAFASVTLAYFITPLAALVYSALTSPFLSGKKSSIKSVISLAAVLIEFSNTELI